MASNDTVLFLKYRSVLITGADPGFPVAGAWTRLGGHGPLTWALFGENVCENERTASRRGGGSTANALGNCISTVIHA